MKTIFSVENMIRMGLRVRVHVQRNVELFLPYGVRNGSLLIVQERPHFSYRLFKLVLSEF
jgi:hypothetical protein